MTQVVPEVAGSQSQYRIRVKGHLKDDWSAWFEGLTVTNEDNGEAVLAGPLPDQAALHAVLRRLHGLNVPLISVEQVVTDQQSTIGRKKRKPR